MSDPGTRFGVPPRAAPLGALKRFVDRASSSRPGEVCDLCAAPIAEEHSHVVNLEGRNLRCTCRPCYLLFTQEGAARGKYRAVPDRYVYYPSFNLGEPQWDQLQIPVRMAFFFFNSALGRFVAFYPSPAGATESLLALDAWQDVLAANHQLQPLKPDVEALLVYGPRGGGFECYGVPINACYELVGRVKLHWKGYDGGEEAWEQIRGFFAALRARSIAVERGEAR
jgi:hypothetical protein